MQTCRSAMYLPPVSCVNYSFLSVFLLSPVPQACLHGCRYIANSGDDLCRARSHPRFLLRNWGSLDRLLKAVGVSVRFSHALYDRGDRTAYLSDQQYGHAYPKPLGKSFVGQAGGGLLGTARLRLLAMSFRYRRVDCRSAKVDPSLESAWCP